MHTIASLYVISLAHLECGCSYKSLISIYPSALKQIIAYSERCMLMYNECGDGLIGRCYLVQAIWLSL